MNRVTAMVARQEAEIQRRLAASIITQELVDKTKKDLDMELDEYVKFQELKSLASTDGTLTLEEAQTVYAYLGETPSVFNDQPAAVKIVLTKLFQELLGKAIKQRGGKVPA